MQYVKEFGVWQSVEETLVIYPKSKGCKGRSSVLNVTLEQCSDCNLVHIATVVWFLGHTKFHDLKRSYDTTYRTK